MSNNIPRSVAADAAQADAQLAELARQLQNAPEPAVITIPDPNTPPAAVTPPPDPNTPPEPQQPTGTGVPVDITRQLQEMQQRISTQEGRIGAYAERNRALEEELARLRTAAAQPPTPAAPPTPPPPGITDQDRQEFGAETVDFVERAIRHHTSGLSTTLQEISNRLAGLEGSVGRVTTLATQVQTETLQQRTLRYEALLDEKVPTWEALQSNQKFLDWLDKRDVLSGRKYGELLTDAHKALDAGRVVELFRVYDPNTVKDSPAAPAPSAQPAAPMVDPATLAAPNTSPAAPAPTQPATGEIWKQSQMDELYARKRKGTISDADFANLEARYMDAARNGRVIIDII